MTPSPALGFIDDFTVLETDRWSTGKEHSLGRSDIRPENVDVSNGQLQMKLPRGELSGAELRSVAALPAGTYQARIKVPNSPDTVTGFFLYVPPDLASEVDIELYNRPNGRARLTTYSDGAMTRTTEVDLPFDPTAGFHDYAIVLFDHGVEFYGDGAVIASWSSGVPSGPMNLYLNAWYPKWLGGAPAIDDHAVQVDSVSFKPH